MNVHHLLSRIHLEGNRSLTRFGVIADFLAKRFRTSHYLELRKKYDGYVSKIGSPVEEKTWDLFLANYLIYGCCVEEFFVLGFPDLSDSGKRKYLTEITGIQLYSKYNDYLQGETLFHNKWNTYEHFKQFYKRDAVKLSVEEDKAGLFSFLEKHKSFIVKIIDGSYGNGIEIIHQQDFSSVDACVTYLHTFGDGILEELIYQSEDMKRFHPQSVNTIRLPVFRTRNGYVIHRPFLRVGTGDHIVDNGGNGGIIIAVDQETGTTISLGIDERGRKFVFHPDTQAMLVGVQLPEWNEAIAAAKKAMDLVPDGINIVGWDLAHTDHGWVIVEGNHKGQFVGQQIAYGSPCRDEVEEIIKEID